MKWLYTKRQIGHARQLVAPVHSSDLAEAVRQIQAPDPTFEEAFDKISSWLADGDVDGGVDAVVSWLSRTSNINIDGHSHDPTAVVDTVLAEPTRAKLQTIAAALQLKPSKKSNREALLAKIFVAWPQPMES